MYAVIKTGGKQYRVTKDEVIIVEKLSAKPGEAIELDQVLMMDTGSGPTVGTPLVDGARVAATVLDQSRGDKVIVFKKKRRKNYRRTRGHRQDQTVLRVTEILAAGQKASPAKAAAPAPKPEPEPAPAAEEAPAVAEPAPEAAEAPPAEAAAKKKKPAAKKKAKAPAKKAAKKPATKKKAPAKKKAAKKKPS